MRNIIFFILFCLLSQTLLTAQSPYKLNVGEEIGYSAGGMALIAASYPLNRQVKPYIQEELDRLDANRIWGIDRWVCSQWSISAQQISDRFLFSSVALPATLLFDQPSRKYFGQVGLLTLETLLITSGLTSLTKTAIRRPRPYLYNPNVPPAVKALVTSRYSFFSGHTSLTASMSFLSAKLYNDFYPESKAKPYIWATAAVIPAITGYLRMKGGNHYVSDVVVGYAVGALVGILVPQLHKVSIE